MASHVALVTGAGKGIGRATAIELASRGYAVALVSRTREDLVETERFCKSSKTLVIPADISRSDEAARCVEQTLEHFSRIDAMVHCAGAVVSRTIENLSIDDWRQMIDTNLSAVLYLGRQLWPVWRKQGGGVMVNVSSYSARDPFPGLGAYGAAKAGVNLLGSALAHEGAPLNIRVHTVAPAATETPMFRSLFTPEQFPTENTLAPADVARVITQCVCGDLACTSGEVIYVHK